MPELMIALLVLAIGLLFIAAALPVGIEYSRRTVDLTSAEAAGEHALRTIETHVRTSRKIGTQVTFWPPVDPRAPRTDSIFRPRWSDPPNSGAVTANMLARDDWEPVIKVRALVMENIGLTGDQRGRRLVDPTEALVTAFLGTVALNNPELATNPRLEVDVRSSLTIPPQTWQAGGGGLLDYPSIPGLLRAYPPIDPVTSFRPERFLGIDAGGDYLPDQPRLTLGGDNPDWSFSDIPIRERLKATDSRLGWVAFYRRVSYAPDSDPLVYEFIVVVTRRPSVNHRYAAQSDQGGPPQMFSRPSALPESQSLPVGGDRLYPVPWLVTFTRIPVNALSSFEFTPDPDGAGPQVARRWVSPGTPQPARLSFRCSDVLGRVVPVGSILIPARNDNDLDGISSPLHPVWGRQAYGFTPSSPDVLPIYRVIDRPDENTVVVENPGIYPWNRNNDPADAAGWPVWIIPPAFAARDSGGQPVFERQSPIVSVVRRTIRLHEYVE